MNSISSCTLFSSLLDSHVREQDVVGAHIGMRLDLLEDPVAQPRAALAVGQVGRGRVRHGVGDDRAYGALLLERAVALGRHGALGARGRNLALGEHERHAELREVLVGEVDQELLREHVDRALDLALGVGGLRDHELVRAGQHDQSRDWNYELELALHGVEPPPSLAAPAWERSTTTSTRRLRERPASVVFSLIGWRAA